ncbi:hypothetical protein PR048_005204 [Dryococelus australis]|uniref:Uncharacterized protein n=1 Tax=Dryococelus australis TaxID=614101 RepID=A0ABQ9I7K0_9NEOP|nr:hypothetical protein PR048_005204 [Dryococelus australis]
MLRVQRTRRCTIGLFIISQTRLFKTPLLHIYNLTLENMAAHCRACEQRKQQVQFIHNRSGKCEYETSIVVRLKKTKANKNSDNGRDFKCTRCQSVHGPMACPAYGKKCTNYGVLNHFARSVIEHVELDSSQESLYCDSVSVELHPIKLCDIPNEWRKKITTEEVSMTVKLYTGAQSINSLKMKPTRVKLKILNSVITPVGKVTLLCQAKGTDAAYINFVLVDLEVMPLLDCLAT